MRFSIAIVFAMALYLWPSMAMSQAEGPQAKNPADAGRELRSRALGLNPAQVNITPSVDFPTVYGVVMDWPVSNANVVSIFCLCDGNASLYTTSTFGIIGGFSHESVNKAAKRFVKTANSLVGDSIPTKDFPYPVAGQVKFYLLTFHGVKVINGNLASIGTGNDKYSDFFGRAQEVIGELRKISMPISSQ